MLAQGYYVATPADTQASIATQLGVDSALLARVNGTSNFADAGFTTGKVVHVPVLASAVTVTGAAQSITAAAKNYALIFDATANKIYKVGGQLDGNGNGQIIHGSTGQAVSLLTTDGVLNVWQPSAGVLKVEGRTTTSSLLPNFTATLESTKVSLTGTVVWFCSIHRLRGLV